MTDETIHIPDAEIGQRLDAILARLLARTSRAQIQQWIKTGLVREATGAILTQASLRVKTPLSLIIARPEKIPFEPPRAEAKPDDLIIVYEDDYLLVVDKPAGISVHPGAGRRDGTLVNMLLGYTHGRLSNVNTQERPGIVHRLDKDTSGLIIIAKTNAVHVALAEALQRRDIKRIYHALVWHVPKPSSGTIETQIGRDAKNRQRMAVLSRSGKTAVTHYRTMEIFGLDAALIECRLQTGRTHQIRVHMAHIHCPVMGDTLYAGRHGRKIPNFSLQVKELLAHLKGQMLHAAHLEFIHPVTQDVISLKAEAPKTFQDLYDALRIR